VLFACLCSGLESVVPFLFWYDARISRGICSSNGHSDTKQDQNIPRKTENKEKALHFIDAQTSNMSTTTQSDQPGEQQIPMTIHPSAPHPPPLPSFPPPWRFVVCRSLVRGPRVAPGICCRSTLPFSLPFLLCHVKRDYCFMFLSQSSFPCNLPVPYHLAEYQLIACSCFLV
jgi:hypothetical protein